MQTAHEQLRGRVHESLFHGASLSEVERNLIDSSPLDEDHRSAVWLAAWVYEQSRAGRRHRQTELGHRELV